MNLRYTLVRGQENLTNTPERGLDRKDKKNESETIFEQVPVRFQFDRYCFCGEIGKENTADRMHG